MNHHRLIKTPEPVNTTQETENNLFNMFRGHIGMTGSYDFNHVLSEKELKTWAETDSRLTCVWCNNILDSDSRFCPDCHNYKGIVPYILGWSA